MRRTDYRQSDPATDSLVKIRLAALATSQRITGGQYAQPPISPWLPVSSAKHGMAGFSRAAA
jgi:hypothetical protein